MDTLSPPTGRAWCCTACGEPSGAGRFCVGCGTQQSALPAGLGTDDLPEQEDGLDLPWELDPEHESPPRRSRGWTVLTSLVLCAVLVAGGVAGARYQADADLRVALASSTRDFNGAVERLAAARSAEQVAAAAEAAPEAAARVDTALERLGSVSEAEDVAVREQLESERALLLALAAFDGLDREPLASWGQAHARVSTAMQAEARSRLALQRHRGGDAAALADTGAMLAGVSAAVGPALVEDATAEATRLLKSLQAARTTQELRALGDAAAPEQAAVEAAAAALAPGEGREVLAGYAAALAAMADLSRLDPERAGGWSGTRAALAGSFGSVAGAAGLGGGNVRAVLGNALGAADAVVAGAAAALAEWKARTEAAVRARTADAAALEAYAASFRAWGKTYEQLRQDLAVFTARVDTQSPGVTYVEAYAFLAQAEQDRRDVRDALVASDVPVGLDDAHQDVVAAVDRSAAAVRSAYEGLEQSQVCSTVCPYYRDTPGWQAFLSESGAVGTAYAEAVARWSAAVPGAKAAIESRPLPARPAV